DRQHGPWLIRRFVDRTLQRHTARHRRGILAPPRPKPDITRGSPRARGPSQPRRDIRRGFLHVGAGCGLKLWWTCLATYLRTRGAAACHYIGWLMHRLAASSPALSWSLGSSPSRASATSMPAGATSRASPPWSLG